MSLTNRSSTFDLQPSRLHQAIQGILLASVLTVSVAANAESTNNTGSVKRSYHISGGSLSQALRQFATNSGLLFSAEAKLTDGKTSAGLDGEYTVEEGLRKLLAGSGLTFTLTNNNSVAIKVAAFGKGAVSTLSPVKVIASAITEEEGPGLGYIVRNSSIGTKMDIPLKELPQSAQVIDKQVIQDQGATTINDVLKNVSGYAPANTMGEEDSEFKLRGFDTGPLKDGEPVTYGYATSARDLMVNLEKVEVIKGPASIAYGASQFGDLGGIINMVTKSPLDTARYQFTSKTDQYGYESPSFDATGPLNQDKTVLYRLTGQSLHRNSFINNLTDNSWGIFPSVTFTNKKDTDLNLKVEYSQRRASYYGGLPYYGTITGPNLNYPIGRSFQDPSSPVLTQPQLISTATLNHKFSDDWSVKAIFRFADSHEKWQGGVYNSWNGQGGVDNAMNISRDYFFYHEKDRDFMGDVQLHGKASVYSTEHELLFGTQHLNYQGDTDLATYNDGSRQFSSINLLNPQYGATPTLANLNMYPHYNNVSNYTGIYIQDHVAITSKLKFLLGGRYNIISDTVYSNIADPTTKWKSDVNEFTPSIGATYAITDSINFYASYNRGVKPTFGTFAPGAHPQAEQSRQYEVGAKFDFHQGLTSSLALFNIVKQHDTIGDPNNLNYSIQVGEVTSQGLETNFIWAVPETGWTMTGNYGYTDAKVSQNISNPSYVGSNLALVPHNSGRLWSMYRFSENTKLSGFRVGGGVFAVDDRQVNMPNTLHLPGYASIDAMLGYAFKHYDVALNLQNLADHRIYETANATNGGVFMGAPFTAVLSLSTTW